MKRFPLLIYYVSIFSLLRKYLVSVNPLSPQKLSTTSFNFEVDILACFLHFCEGRTKGILMAEYSRYYFPFQFTNVPNKCTFMKIQALTIDFWVFSFGPWPVFDQLMFP